MWRALLGFCLAPAAAGVYVRAQAPAPVFDELFKEPYVDVDAWRDTPVRHRYVHGGFKGTDTRFSIYLPPKEQYQGRFFQHITPVPDNENLAQIVPAGEYSKIGFSIASGAYFLETNGGGHLDLGKAAGARPDPTIGAYRANAASAQYSRVVAQRMYGGRRPYGYAYGGSGGGVPHGRVDREHDRRVGRRGPVRAGLDDGDSQHVHGPHPGDADPEGQVPADPRRGGARWKRRSLCRPDGGAGRRPSRGHADGLPHGVLVRLQDDGHPRVRGDLPGHGQRGPGLLHGLLDQAGLPWLRSSGAVRGRPASAQDNGRVSHQRSGSGASRPQHECVQRREARRGRHRLPLQRGCDADCRVPARHDAPARGLPRRRPDRAERTRTRTEAPARADRRGRRRAGHCRLEHRRDARAG